MQYISLTLDKKTEQFGIWYAFYVNVYESYKVLNAIRF